MNYYIYLATLIFILAGSTACSKDEPVMNHDLDNTVWIQSKTPIVDQRDYIEGFMFSDGYCHKVKLHKTYGNVISKDFSLKYSVNNSHGAIYLYKTSGELSDMKVGYLKGIIHFNSFEFFLAGTKYQK